MAITPSQWSHVLTIPESYTPTSATSGQTLVITESVIAKLSTSDQATFWGAVQNGGGDVRICENEDGTSQLPVEVVSLDKEARTCVIWIRKPSYNGTANIYLFVGKAGETQPSVTDAFGRNAVWQDYLLVQHLDSNNYTDATGSGRDGSAVGTISQTSVNHPFGGVWSDFVGGSTRLPLSNTSGILNNEYFHVKAWVEADVAGEGAAGGVVSNRSSSGGNWFMLVQRPASSSQDWQGALHDGSGESPLLTFDSPSLGSAERLSLSSSAGGLSLYGNGQPRGTVGFPGDGQIATLNSIQIGNYFNNSLGFNGRIGEVWIALGSIDAKKELAEYTNQSNPASFFGMPTISETGGAAGVTSDVAYTIASPAFSASADATQPQPASDVSFTISAPTFAASAQPSLPQPISDIAFNIAPPAFNSTASATLPQPIGNTAFAVSAPTFSGTASVTQPGYNASVSFSIGKPEFTSSASVTLPQPSVTVNYAVQAPAFNASATASLPQPIGDVSVSIDAPTFAATADATQPGYNASVNFEVNAPTFSVDAAATLPQPIADGNFTISAPTFSVVAIVGGIAIIVDDSTNINVPALSNNVTMPALSNNVNL